MCSSTKPDSGTHSIGMPRRIMVVSWTNERRAGSSRRSSFRCHTMLDLIGASWTLYDSRRFVIESLHPWTSFPAARAAVSIFVGDDLPVLHLISSVAAFRRTAWLSFTVFSARARRRFSRSAGRRAADPNPGAGAANHSLSYWAVVLPPPVALTQDPSHLSNAFKMHWNDSLPRYVMLSPSLRQ